jgi:hypothetical protein
VTTKLLITRNGQAHSAQNVEKSIITFSAWAVVLGKPSRMKPFLHSGLSRLTETIFKTSSSLTSCPASITFLISRPISDPLETSALSRSPVARGKCYKTFSSSLLTLLTNNLHCLSLSFLYSLIKCLRVRPEITRVKHLSGAPLWVRILAIRANMRQTL